MVDMVYGELGEAAIPLQFWVFVGCEFRMACEGVGNQGGAGDTEASICECRGLDSHVRAQCAPIFSDHPPHKRHERGSGGGHG